MCCVNKNDSQKTKYFLIDTDWKQTHANNNGTLKQIMSGKGLLLCCCLRDYEAMCYATCHVGEITNEAQPDEMSEAITVAVSCWFLVSYL